MVEVIGYLHEFLSSTTQALFITLVCNFRQTNKNQPWARICSFCCIYYQLPDFRKVPSSMCCSRVWQHGRRNREPGAMCRVTPSSLKAPNFNHKRTLLAKMPSSAIQGSSQGCVAPSKDQDFFLRPSLTKILICLNRGAYHSQRISCTFNGHPYTLSRNFSNSVAMLLFSQKYRKFRGSRHSRSTKQSQAISRNAEKLSLAKQCRASWPFFWV